MQKNMRKQYDAAFKLKMVLEMYKNEKTLAQIAAEYQVHPTQLHIWKNQFKVEGPSIFQKTKDQEKADLKELIDELYKQIGQLKVEWDWQKNLKCSPKEKVRLLEKDHPKLSISDQCRLLGIARSTAYYSAEVSEYELRIMDEIDRIFTAHPYHGK